MSEFGDDVYFFAAAAAGLAWAGAPGMPGVAAGALISRSSISKISVEFGPMSGLGERWP